MPLSPGTLLSAGGQDRGPCPLSCLHAAEQIGNNALARGSSEKSQVYWLPNDSPFFLAQSPVVWGSGGGQYTDLLMRNGLKEREDEGAGQGDDRR